MTTPSDPFSGQQPQDPGAAGSAPYGSPPPGYGSQQPGYGTPPPGYGTSPPGYGNQPAYGGDGAPGSAASPFGQPGGPRLAGWGSRVQSAVIDWFGPSLLAGFVQSFISEVLGSLLVLAALAWALYNAYLQGSTGQSVGKGLVGTRLLREQDGQVIGGGLGIGRYFLHILDALPFYLGFLWPLWDGKKQTFADKIVKSVVVHA